MDSFTHQTSDFYSGSPADLVKVGTYLVLFAHFGGLLQPVSGRALVSVAHFRQVPGAVNHFPGLRAPIIEYISFRRKALPSVPRPQSIQIPHLGF